ncbi:ArnT family glycosyltransferase [Anaerosinus gibii]|uniref:Glycosyltransferase family 39 protein n=1 Tax=Selenobaculum gibii TaxID=3054208 RepID=A0A9Y2AHT3_9FIRM|nr:glycosyltransferase family 39 protein [Selenobaculum gbiensis]WIW69928.1 glycosyltransferase family 39 protein [Selenobaculum gbiensis]
MERKNLDVIIILIVAGFIMLFKLGAVPLLDPDEPVYIQTALEMLNHNDFISPRIYGDFWYDKPPMYYWLIALAVKFFGATELSARLPSAVLAIAGAMLVYYYGNRLFDRRSALYGALILVTSFEYFYLGKAAVTDITLSCFFSGVIFAYLSKQYRLMYVFMGLSVLTKGPVGIVLPLAIILLHLIATKNWIEIFNLKIFQGGIIFLLITVPWYGMMYNLHGMDFIETFLGFHNVTRFLSPEHESGQIWYYYLPVLCIGFFPWVSYLLPALYEGWREKNKEKGKNILALMIWLSIVFVFFSVSQTKLISYILPMYPPMALLTGWYMNRCIKEFRIKTLNFAGAGMMLISLLIFIVLEITAEYKLGIQINGIKYLGVLFVGMVSWVFLSNFVKNRRCYLLGIVVGMMGFVVILMNCIFPAITDFVSVKPTAEVFNEVYVNQSTPVYVEKFYRPGFCYYTGVAGRELKTDLQAAVKGEKEAYFLVREKNFDQLSIKEKENLMIINKQKDVLLLYKVQSG